MAQLQVNTPKGTRDFSPEELRKREYIFSVIKKYFSLYGFVPIETPAMENLSSLLGKYGEEGDKLLFKILNSGDFLSGVQGNDFTATSLAGKICEKGLRYDLTVPFARYVVQHYGKMVFPFKRYQIQPVWRADRPQKGRYREFVQCDADVIGSDALINEAELLMLIHDVFAELGCKIRIHINSRKILSAIASLVGAPEKLIAITVAIDKLDKIGREEVQEELQAGGFSGEQIQKIVRFLAINGTNQEKTEALFSLLGSIAEGRQGIEEINALLCLIEGKEVTENLQVDFALARGLSYYTGMIFEVKARDVQIGSICGGGRYDNLTGIFGLSGMSGVGVSFGADRIYDVLEQLALFPDTLYAGSKVMVANFSTDDTKDYLSIVSDLRKKNIACEVYPDPVKLKKQLAYADAKKISYVVLIGEEEKKEGVVTLRNMFSGEQTKVALHEIASIVTRTC